MLFASTSGPEPLHGLSVSGSSVTSLAFSSFAKGTNAVKKKRGHCLPSSFVHVALKCTVKQAHLKYVC